MSVSWLFSEENCVDDSAIPMASALTASEVTSSRVVVGCGALYAGEGLKE